MFELIPGRLSLNNPVMAASGTFGYGLEFAKNNDAHQLGALVCKGITREPRSGHPPPRIIETASGVLNAIGLANVGVEAIISAKAPQWVSLGTPVIVNVNGESIDDYVAVASLLNRVPGVAGLELNISCPNVAAGGMSFGIAPGPASEVTAAVRAANDSPLLVKLTPNTESIVEVAQAVIEAGAEALTVANTFLGMAVDYKTGKPRLSNVTGGLSGPAIKPITLRLVYEVARSVTVPVIGCGGITTGQDAAEYFAVGASAVQVGTANLIDPFAVPRVARELAAIRERKQI